MVRDEGPGLPRNWDPERMAHIGIGNTRDRLRQMYGDRNQIFAIHSEPGEGVRVEICIPLEHSSGEPPAVPNGSPGVAGERAVETVTDYGHHSRISR